MPETSVDHRPLTRLWVAVVLAVASGLLLWSAFPPVGFGPSAPVGVALLTAALWGARVRRGVGLGLVSGVVFFLPLLAWIRVVGDDAWILLSLWCGAWVILIGVGTTLASRLPVAPLWIASTWTLVEALRGRIPWGGFPWGSLSFSQADTGVGDWASIGGTPLVTFAVALTGACLTALALSLSRARWRAAIANGVAIAALTAVAGWLAPWAVPAPSADRAAVAVVQGGTPQTGMGAMDVRRAVLDNHVAQTLDLAQAVERGEAPAPDFVLWPENASDIDPFADATVAADITAASRAVGVPILVGAVTTSPEDPDEVWNVGIVWTPDQGPTDLYVKTHPVPFGEFIPFRDQLSDLIGRFDRIPRDFAAGDRPGNLDIAGVAVGDVICFEIAYSDVVAAVVAGGAEVITVQTNNATYGGTAQPDQQVQIERMRAAETGRTVLVAATSGVSAEILPDRRITQSIAEGDVGWFVSDVALVDRPTWATVIGAPLEWVLCSFVLVALIVGEVVRRRHRQSPRLTR